MQAPREECVPVQVVQVTARCECGGEMRPSGRYLLSHPVQVPHQCTSCQRTEVYPEPYPLVRYQAIG